MFNLRIFVLELENDIAIFKIKALELALLQSLVEFLKFETKNDLTVILGLQFENNIATLLIQHTRICLIRNFCEILKMSKFAIKNALFGFF